MKSIMAGCDGRPERTRRHGKGRMAGPDQNSLTAAPPRSAAGLPWPTNERDARNRLQAVKDGREEYVAAVFDVMVVIADLEDLMELNEMFFVKSEDTGIRLARFAREELGISERQLPIASLMIRDDEPVKTAMKELGIPLFHRTPSTESENIDRFIDKHLPSR